MHQLYPWSISSIVKLYQNYKFYIPTVQQYGFTIMLVLPAIIESSPSPSSYSAPLSRSDRLLNDGDSWVKVVRLLKAPGLIEVFDRREGCSKVGDLLAVHILVQLLGNGESREHDIRGGGHGAAEAGTAMQEKMSNLRKLSG